MTNKLYKVTMEQVAKAAGNLILANDLPGIIAEKDPDFYDQLIEACTEYVADDGEIYYSIDEIPEGMDYDIQEDEVFQWYIVDAYGADFIENCVPDETVLYSEVTDLYFWPIYFFGMSWSDVYTECTVDLNERFNK